MSETVETAVRYGISGQFLDNRENFSEISLLFAKLYSSSPKLQAVEEQLRNCNNPGWLIFFENRCKRLRRDPKHDLVSLVQKLEGQKATLQAAVENTRQSILKLEPTAFDTKTTLAGASPMYHATPIRRRIGNPDIVSRKAVIDAHRDESDKKICTLLDFHLGVPGRRTLGIPDSWFTKCGVSTFSEAYLKCPELVHPLISKHRR
jgi:hypothetical protein